MNSPLSESYFNLYIFIKGYFSEHLYTKQLRTVKKVSFNDKSQISDVNLLNYNIAKLIGQSNIVTNYNRL